MAQHDHRHDEPAAGPVIRDRRRIDPATGKVREQSPGASRGKHARGPAGSENDAAAAPPPTAPPPSPAPAPGNADAPEAAARLAERTADLQRVQAEYANYRKRVERDRVAVREQALANVLVELLPVLDDIGRAREHGELSGGFKSVAEVLEAAVTKLGLAHYGEPGEPFDPTVHEALLHSYSERVTEPTCIQILQPGYKVAERILRPARVEVAEPGPGEAASGESAPGAADAGPDTGHHAGPGAGQPDQQAPGGQTAPDTPAPDQPPQPRGNPDLTGGN